MTTVREAKDQVIYVINGDNEIEETNLYDWVMISAEETTSPIGVWGVLHIRHEDYSDNGYGYLNAVKNDDGLYEVWSWRIGNRGTFIESFETEEEAEDFIFDRIEKCDFSRDDQRDTMYYFTEEEAQGELIRLYAERNYVSEECAKSILHHEEIRRQIIEQREEESRVKADATKKENNERIEHIASEYANLITITDGESYKETARRLSQAIGERIEGAVFHATVKMIRRGAQIKNS